MTLEVDFLDFAAFKVHIFWEGHKFLRNLHRRFVLCNNGQIYDGDFAKFCGLLRIYELYKVHDEFVPQVCWHYYSVKKGRKPFSMRRSQWLHLHQNGPFVYCWSGIDAWSLWQYLFLSFKFGDTKLVSSKETSVSFNVIVLKIDPFWLSTYDFKIFQ